MTLQEFIDKFELSLKFKATDEDSFTPDHTKYKVKIKSPILGNLKTEYHTSMRPELHDLLESLFQDYMGYINYSDVSEFIAEYGCSDADELKRGMETWETIQSVGKEINEWLSYFEEDFLGIEL